MALSEKTLRRAIDGIHTQRYQFWEQLNHRALYWPQLTDDELREAIAIADASVDEIEQELASRV